MSGRRRTPDRRARPRFEVVGDLWGTLEIVQPLPVLNIGTGGALIMSGRRWQIGSVHSLLVANGSEVGRVEICVRHVTEAGEGRSDRFAIGVQFLSISPALAAEISRWIRADADEISES